MGQVRDKTVEYAQVSIRAGLRSAPAPEPGRENSEAKAWDQLRKVDSLRSADLRELYGRDPADPTLYHIVFDTAALPLDACPQTAAAAAVHP
jgi:hypothetical protein